MDSCVPNYIHDFITNVYKCNYVINKPICICLHTFTTNVKFQSLEHNASVLNGFCIRKYMHKVYVYM